MKRKRATYVTQECDVGAMVDAGSDDNATDREDIGDDLRQLNVNNTESLPLDDQKKRMLH